MWNLKLKDLIGLALYSVVYMIIFMAMTSVMKLAGPMGDRVAVGVSCFVLGTLIYFVAHKVGKMWQFTIITTLVCAMFALMGAGYIPWFITSISAAVIADFLASGKGYVSTPSLAIGNGLMAVGLVWGNIIPSWFFAESFKADWVSRGVDPAYMDNLIVLFGGTAGAIITVVTFVLGFAGVYLGQALLKKHFKS